PWIRGATPVDAHGAELAAGAADDRPRDRRAALDRDLLDAQVREARVDAACDDRVLLQHHRAARLKELLHDLLVRVASGRTHADGARRVAALVASVQVERAGERRLDVAIELELVLHRQPITEVTDDRSLPHDEGIRQVVSELDGP